MPKITPAANEIFTEEADFRSPDSENFKTRLGGSINYMLQRNAQVLTLNGEGWHNLTQLSDLQPIHKIRRDCNINTYSLSNLVNGSGGTDIRINAKVYDESNTLLGDLFSVAPSINSAIDTAGASAGYNVGRYVEDSQDWDAGTNKVVGTLNYTSLNEGYGIRFFIESIQTDGAGFCFQLWIREAA
jgi:hypothetical protein